MRFRTAFSLASLFLFLSAVAVLTQPVRSQPLPHMAHSVATTQTTAGRISSVGDATFALEVKKNQDVQNLEFMVDENTKVQGKLEVGANATVDYNSVEGKNLAVRVIVQQTSGH